MPKKQRSSKEIILKTMDDFDRNYFPSLVSKRQTRELIEKPAEFGAKLAREVISDLKKGLR